MTKDAQSQSQSIEGRVAQHHNLDLAIRKAIAYPTDPEQRRLGLEAMREVAKLLGLDVAIPPIPMILACPSCSQRHVDEGEFATKVHHTHACQSCGMVWRPALVATVGVQFLPGFKNP